MTKETIRQVYLIRHGDTATLDSLCYYRGTPAVKRWNAMLIGSGHTHHEGYEEREVYKGQISEPFVPFVNFVAKILFIVAAALSCWEICNNSRGGSHGKSIDD